MAGWAQNVVTSESDPAALVTTKMPLVEDVYSCDITKQPTGNCGPPLIFPPVGKYVSSAHYVSSPPPLPAPCPAPPTSPGARAITPLGCLLYARSQRLTRAAPCGEQGRADAGIDVW